MSHRCFGRGQQQAVVPLRLEMTVGVVAVLWSPAVSLPVAPVAAVAAAAAAEPAKQYNVPWRCTSQTAHHWPTRHGRTAGRKAGWKE